MDGEREEEKGSETDVWATRDPLTVIVTEVDGPPDILLGWSTSEPAWQST